MKQIKLQSRRKTFKSLQMVLELNSTFERVKNAQETARREPTMKRSLKIGGDRFCGQLESTVRVDYKQLLIKPSLAFAFFLGQGITCYGCTKQSRNSRNGESKFPAKTRLSGKKTKRPASTGIFFAELQIF